MGKLENMPLSWFKVKPQVRRTFDEAELRQLGESMKVKQLQAVIALPDGTLLAGERRWRAASLVGMPHLLVMVVEGELNETETKILQLAENIHRSDLSGYEKWIACTELMTINIGWNCKDLAEHLKLDASSVTRLLSPSKTIGAVQDALKEGKIGISDCYAISKASSLAEQATMLAAKLSGASRDEIEQAGRNSRRAKQPAVRVSRIKCALPSGLSITVSGQELSLEEASEAFGEAQKAIKKAITDGLDAKTWQAVMRDKAKAG